MVWLWILFVCVTARQDRYIFGDNMLPTFNKLKNSYPMLDVGNMTSVFPPLLNVDNGADPVAESKYSWLARVVHSRTASSPHMCTATCIKPAIFITAATCVANLKIEHTTVIYLSRWLRVKAMVISANLSRQGFDDIGFLISFNIPDIKWIHITMYNGPNRTDNEFKWFENYSNEKTRVYRVIGFSSPAIEVDNYYWDKQYYLSELWVVMHYKICPRFLPPTPWSIYKVPCYYTCTDDSEKIKVTDDQIISTGECARWHQVVGSALIWIDTSEEKKLILMGVSTWSLGLGKLNLPVGIAVPNSESYYKNYRCAIKIRDDQVGLKPGHYQSLCKG